MRLDVAIESQNQKAIGSHSDPFVMMHFSENQIDGNRGTFEEQKKPGEEFCLCSHAKRAGREEFESSFWPLYTSMV
ncbi:MAG TPA: hypothetical protein DEQ80_03930 [Anaerolinea thermolimosa]|uniref:Uncharacterized protein n=1 Tax=Anaerolinea thermolimosa TaxID=229919 RepID=A0A3D1JEJ4_9CHLR|nr:hypothetical protein [Anaerolinea thermolimosa]